MTTRGTRLRVLSGGARGTERRMGESPAVIIVGAGIAGVAAAREVHAAGLPVRLIDRGHRIGGRMAVRTVAGRPIDVGASYFTVSDPAFREVVNRWAAAGLARPWTDTFLVAGDSGLEESPPGPMRYGTPYGLRTLVEELAEGLEIRHPDEVSEITAGPQVDGVAAVAVALAMPDPQALDLLADGFVAERAILADRDWEPVLVLYARWSRRDWPAFDGIFVNEHDVLARVIDDGRRRGDGVPVLVAHSSGAFAERHLDEPASAGPTMLRAVCELLGIPTAPEWANITRWSLAAPASPHPEAYHLAATGIGLCGDGWVGASESPRPRVEAAFLSGRALGRALAEQLS
jgi:renalase